MATLWLVLVVVLVIAGLVFGVVSLLSGDDPGLVPVDPDGRARPLPNDRSLRESDLSDVRFDVVVRGYRMSQVDRMLRRTSYDLGYKDEMIAVLEAEVMALREGRLVDANLLRSAREAAASPEPAPAAAPTRRTGQAEDRGPDFTTPAQPEPEAGAGDDEAGDAVAGPTAEPEPEPEPREGSLRRRKPAPDASRGGNGHGIAEARTDPDGTAAARTDPADGEATGDGGQPSLEAADRPAHA